MYKRLLIIICLIVSNVSYASLPPVEGFSALVDRLVPAVVNVSTTQTINNNKMGGKLQLFPDGSPFQEFNDLFERFGIMPPEFEEHNQERKANSLGSGFIIDPEGYIVTNYHVIAEAEEVEVILNDDRHFKATIVGYDAKTDLALLKISTTKPLPYVKFGNSDIAKVGDWVLAIGNPFGLGGTVTAGIISAISRDINMGGFVDNFIQTDAAINKGSSGGPMFNMDGEVIGINTAIFSPSGGNVGIGFATPSSLAKPLLEQIKNKGKVQRSWLGVKIQPIDDEVVESLGLESKQGALVSEVTAGSPAAKAGISVGDIIIAFDGKQVNNNRKLPRIVGEIPVGKKVEVTLIRKGKEKKLNVILAEFVDNLTEEKNNSKYGQDKQLADENVLELSGVTLATLNDDIKQRFDVPEKYGVVVMSVKRTSSWLKRGIQRGDIIVGVNQESVNNTLDLKRAIDMAKKQGKKSALFLISRSGQTIFVTLPLN
jgi:serine protease Do